jgi:hypothetical protein
VGGGHRCAARHVGPGDAGGPDGPRCRAGGGTRGFLAQSPDTPPPPSRSMTASRSRLGITGWPAGYRVQTRGWPPASRCPYADADALRRTTDPAGLSWRPRSSTILVTPVVSPQQTAIRKRVIWRPTAVEARRRDSRALSRWSRSMLTGRSFGCTASSGRPADRRGRCGLDAAAEPADRSRHARRTAAIIETLLTPHDENTDDATVGSGACAGTPSGSRNHGCAAIHDYPPVRRPSTPCPHRAAITGGSGGPPALVGGVP